MSPLFKKHKKKGIKEQFAHFAQMNPFAEYAFLKSPREKMRNVTISRSSNNVYAILKTLRFKDKIIHNHPYTNKISTIPSFEDILNRGKNIILINDGTLLRGSIHYRREINKSNLIENINERYNKITKKLNLNKNKQYSEKSIDFIINEFQNIAIYQELIKDKKALEYLNKNKKTPYTDPKNIELINIAFKNKILRPEQVTKYLEYQHLFNNKKTLLEIYKLLGIKVRYVPNRKDGYVFDEKNIDFIKK